MSNIVPDAEIVHESETSLVPLHDQLPVAIDIGPIPTDPHAIREEIRSLSKIVTNKFLRLARLLDVVKHHRYYMEWGYESFEQYVREDAALHVETANTFIQLEQKLVQQAQIPRETIAEIGWTKAKAILPVANMGKITPENKEEIIEKAKALPTAQLRTYIDETFRKDGAAPALSSFTFFFSAEHLEIVTRARELAGQLINSVDPGVQLAAVCSEFLSTITEHDTKAPDVFRLRRLQTMVEILDKSYGLEVVLQGKTPHGKALLKKFQQTDKKRPVI